MKRSDIVNIIAESLVEPRFTDDIFKEASYILKRIERKGMLPPLTIKHEKRGTLCPTYITKYCNEWDLEESEMESHEKK